MGWAGHPSMVYARDEQKDRVFAHRHGNVCANNTHHAHKAGHGRPKAINENASCSVMCMPRNKAWVFRC